MDKDNKKVKDKITISITPDLHRALFMKALEDRTSISQIIENTLKDAEEFKNKFLPKVREYNEEGVELSAASPHSLERNRNTPRVITFLHEEDPEPHSQEKKK